MRIVSLSQPTSRTNQKQRTRADLLRAARKLMGEGQQPTVADAADAAGISRATAYRYFSKPEELIREATLDALAELAGPAAPDGTSGDTVEQRLDSLVTRVLALITDNEALFRTFLAHAVSGPAEPRRGGRRLIWLREILRPVEHELDEPARDRLIHALSLLMGIEPVIVLRDIAGLDQEEASAVLRWAAQALLSTTLAQKKGAPA